jgi:DNA-binding response OmpR family regulator
MRLGANDSIVNPFNAADLVARLATLITHSRPC